MGQQVLLVTGAARSGKSTYAESRATMLGSRRLYVATAEPNDDEMARRISVHKKRRGPDWVTLEEPLKLAETLSAPREQIDCALVDCLTLWLSNLLLHGTVTDAEEKVHGLIAVLPRLSFHVVLVTNEVGWGIVPENELGRRFRDLLGWANQQFAAAAHEVVLTVAGLPLVIKKAPA
jgi:adenosylcobinamide kinase/adenosylcobinamide-phosphate guanylyltransferase